MNLRGGHFPDEQQTLLLKAALSERLDAIRYFVSWLEFYRLDKLNLNSTNFLSDFMDSIDKGSQRMLPLVIHNLGEDTHPYFKFLIGTRKNFWVVNKQIAHRTAEVLKILAQNGISGMPIKGLDLATNYYENIGHRPMNNGDILIPFEFKKQAIELVKKGALGNISVSYGLEVKELAQTIHLRFEGNVGVDLHWNIFHEYAPIPDASDFIWRDATKVNTYYQMSATHTLFISLVNGRRFDSTPPFRWVADAKTIIEKSDIDWDELLTLVKRFHFKPFLKRALVFLIEQFHLNIPDNFVERLNEIEVDELEKKYYLAISRNNKKYGFIGLVWFGINKRMIQHELFLKQSSGISLAGYLFSWAFNRARVSLTK